MAEELKNTLSCPDRQTWAAFVDGGGDRAGLEAHLAQCDHCYSVVAALRLSLARADAESAQPTPAALLRQAQGLPLAAAKERRRWPFYLAAAAVLLVAATATLRQDGSQEAELLAYGVAAGKGESKEEAAPLAASAPRRAASVDRARPAPPPLPAPRAEMEANDAVSRQDLGPEMKLADTPVALGGVEADEMLDEVGSGALGAAGDGELALADARMCTCAVLLSKGAKLW